MKSPGYDRHIWLVCLLLALGIFAIYGPVLRHGFTTIDDGQYVTDNPHVQNGLTLNGFVWAFTTGHASNWHPLTWLSHMLDCQLYGLKPAGHHLTNLLLHVLNSWLLFAVLRRMTGALWRSAAVAALFAWHPLHVESVAWIAERKDVLSTFFGLLTLLAWIGYVARPAKARYVSAVLLYALGLMSKPMLVTLPFVLLLLDFWPLGRLAGRQVPNRNPKTEAGRKPLAGLVLEKAPFFALALAGSVVTFLVQRHGGAVMSIEHLPLDRRFADALLACAGYLRKTAWPSDLAAFYPLPGSVSVSRLIAAGAVLVFISVVAVFWRRRYPWLVVGWLWFLGMLVPVLGLVQVGSQSMADRYTYLPLVGVFIMVVWGLAEILGPEHLGRPNLGWAFAAPALLACLVAACVQANYWKDDETLFRHALAVTTGNVTAHINLGSALNREGKLKEARDQLLAALALEPDSAIALGALGANCSLQGDTAGAEHYLTLAVRLQPGFSDAQFNLGNVLAAQDKFAEAAEHFAIAARVDPDLPDVHNNYGIVLARLGRFDEAAVQFKAALAIRPGYPQAHDLLGGALSKLGRLDEAAAQYAEALRLKPDFVHARVRLGVILTQQGRFAEAVTNLVEAVRLEPANPDAHLQLATAYAAQTNLAPAVDEFAAALRLNRNQPDACARLAVVLVKLGRLDEAAGFYREALRLAPDRVEFLRDFAWFLATNPKAELRNGAEAVRLAELAVQLNQRPDAAVLSALDAAYAEAGRFDDAIKTATQVQQLAAAASQTEVASRAARRLESYRADKPWRE